MLIIIIIILKGMIHFSSWARKSNYSNGKFCGG